MKKRSWKQALSMLLAVALMATLLVVPAVAADAPTRQVHNFENNNLTSTFYSFSNDKGATWSGALNGQYSGSTTITDSTNTEIAITNGSKVGSSSVIKFTAPAAGTCILYLSSRANNATKMGGVKLNNSAATLKHETGYSTLTFETAANTDYQITRSAGDIDAVYIEWNPKATTPAFVTAVSIKGADGVEAPVVPVRDENVTVNLVAEVTGGTKGTVKDWTIAKADGTAVGAAEGLTLTAGTDEKSATLVIDASKVVRGKYTISATSVDPKQGTSEGETAYMTGTTTLTINRAVLTDLKFSTDTQTAVTDVKYGAEPIELVTEATWAENSAEDCIIKPADTADAVTWESSNTDVATVSTGEVNNDGKGTLTIVGVGSTTITATSVRNKDDGGKATVTLNVTVDKGETALKLSSPRNKQVVSAGGSLLFTLDGVPSNATKDPYEYVTVTPSNGVTITAPESGDKPYDDGSTPGTAGWNVKVSLPANGETTDKEYTVTAAWGDEANDLWTVTDDTEGQTVKVLGSGSKNIKIMGQTGFGATVKKTSGDASLVLSADAVLNDSDGQPVEDQSGLTFTWKHGDDVLTAGDRVSIASKPCEIEGHTGHTESTLTIADVKMADAGAYHCVVTHDDVSSDEPIQADFTVEVAKATVSAPEGVDYAAQSRALSGVSTAMEYSLDGKATWKTIDSVTEGVYTVPEVDAETAKAVTGIDVRVKETDETLASEATHIVLKRAQTPALQAGNESLIVTNYDADFHGLYQVKGGTYADWTDVTDTASDDNTTTTIAGLVNGTEYQVQVKDYGHVLKTLTPATGTPKEPAGDPTELQALVQEAKNKVIGIWYADNAADVLASQKFVPTADGTKYNEAIKAAETVANAADAGGKPTSTTTELNAAKAKLEEAMSTFDGLEKKDGTKKQDAFILNMNEVTKVTLEHGSPANEVTGLGTQGFFTLLGNKSGSKETSKATVMDGDTLFADGFYGYQRWNPQGKVEINKNNYYKGIKFTTTVADAKVKVWARNNGSDGTARHIGVIGQATVTGTTDYNSGEYKVETLTLATAGTYYLGAADSTLHIYRVEVVQPGVDPVPTPYDITVAAADNGTVKTTVGGEEADSAYEGDEVTIVATPANTGFEVDTVKVTKADNSEVTVNENKFTMPAEAVTVTVTFKSTGITPTTSAITKAAATNGSFTVKVGGVEVNEAAEGSTVVITPTAEASYEVDAVTTAPTAAVTEEDDGTYTFTMPGEAVTVTVTFKAAQVTPTEHNITVTAGEHGTATASAAKAVKGTEITLTITPEQGYEVDQITSADVTVANNKFTMPDKDVAISVTFKAIGTTPVTKYTVTVADTEHGTVSVDKEEAAEGEEVTITFDPETGYIVESIVVKDADGTGVDVTDNKFTMPAKNVTVTVTFRSTSVNPPEVDKTELTAAIEAAEAVDTTGVAVSEDGADVPTSEKWIAKSVMDDFDKALADAKTVADKAKATQAEVDAAKEALAAATAALTDAIDNAQNGTKEVTKDDLTAAIAAAEKAVKAITVDTDAKNVKKGTKWVTAEVKSAYETAIAEAKTVADDAEATAEEVAQALATLNTATRIFDEAKQDGAKSSGGSSGGISGGVGVDNNTNKKTETLTDGTKRVTETAKDGTVTVTDTKSDGTKTVTTTTPAGEVTTDVTLGRDTESVQVSVPVDKAESGMVAVIVKPDGTEEIIRDSVVVDDSVIFDLDENATVKIVNNAKNFVDIGGHWAKSDVDYVTARELFNGVDATHFAPDTTMTRGMMATVLFRLDGETKAEKTVDFSDVTAGDWFAEAVDWAAEAGVINGYTDGSFGPNSSITREELVVMIYRYAGAPKVDAAMGMAGFNDVDQISTWAETAMRWAVQNGIIQGKGNGTLDPQGNATRAEVSAVLQRYVRLSK